MIKEIDDTEFNIPLFDSAVKKNKACKQMVEFTGHKSCKIFFHRFDTSIDIISICGSCKANTKKPTTSDIDVRFY